MAQMLSAKLNEGIRIAGWGEVKSPLTGYFVLQAVQMNLSGGFNYGRAD